MAIAHFALGVLATALLFTVALPRAARSPTVILAGGVWGVVPDVHWVLPMGSALVKSFHGTVWANVFWFHQFVDIADPSNSRPLAAGIVALMLVVVPVCEQVAAMQLSPKTVPISEEPSD